VFEPDTGDLEERVARLEQQDERLTRALELLAQREAAPSAKAGRDWDAYAAVIASFIGLLALAVSGYTAHVQRQQLRAQVWPSLRLEYSNVNPSFSAINQGTGPARITAVRVKMDGVPVRRWADIRKSVGFTGEGEFVIMSTLHDAVISPGAVFTIAKPGDNEQSRAKFEELLPNGKHAISIVVCYCSILKDCWFAGVGRLGPADIGGANSVDEWGGCPIHDGVPFED